MSERSIALLLQDMAHAVEKIFTYTRGFTFDDYVADSKTRDAVERNFEIIGEAASRVPEAFKQENAVIEWRIVKDFRNVISHDYFGVNDRIVWETIGAKLPDLLDRLNGLKAKHPTGEQPPSI